MITKQIADRLKQADAMIADETKRAEQTLAELEAKDKKVMGLLKPLQMKDKLTVKEKKEYAELLHIQQIVRHSYGALKKQMGLG